jgi:hypothetical protein
LSEDVFEIFLGEQARTAGANEATVPYGMFCLKTLQFSKFRIRGSRRRGRNACVFN